MQQIRFKRLHEAAVLPKAAFSGDALDLSAVEETILQPNVPTLVKTGWAIELPANHYAWVTPRSGLALKHGVTVWNAPGRVDELYRGEVGVVLLWSGWSPNVNMHSTDAVKFDGSKLPWPVGTDSFMRFRIAPGDRIAQLTLSRIEPFEIAEADELSETARATGGFGSTGR